MELFVVQDREKLKYEEMVHEVKLNIGVWRVADLYVLSLVGFGRVINNYEMTMEFKLGEKKKIWTALSTKEVKSCEA